MQRVTWGPLVLMSLSLGAAFLIHKVRDAQSHARVQLETKEALRTHKRLFVQVVLMTVRLLLWPLHLPLNDVSVCSVLGL
jgi:hypothetical protein